MLKISPLSFVCHNDNIFIQTYSTILLWNNNIDLALEVAGPLFHNKEMQKEPTGDIELVICMFIAKKQYNFVHKVFEENHFQIKDRLKPIYYALMHFMQDKYPDEIKKMGDELNEPVESIVKYILELREKYK